MNQVIATAGENLKENELCVLVPEKTWRLREAERRAARAALEWGYSDACTVALMNDFESAKQATDDDASSREFPQEE